MRYLARFALPFCAVLLLCGLVPLWWLAWVIAAASAAGFALCLWKANERRTKLCLLLAGVCLGAAWFGVYDLLFVRPALWAAGTESAFTAEVAAYPSATEHGVFVTLRVQSGTAAGQRAEVWLPEHYASLKPGDTIRGTAQYESVLERENRSAAADGVFLRGTVEVSEVYSAPSVPARYALQRLGRWVRETALAYFDGERGALLAGLLTGDKSALSAVTWSSFRRAGMAHLLAVSGLHVGFLTGILYLLPGQKRRRTILAVPILVGFAVMTGGSSSVWRAVIMSVLLLAAPLFNRESDPPTSLSFALLVLLVQNPYAAQSVSLQLSFAAVTGLVCLYPPLYRGIMRPWAKKWKRRKLWRATRVLASAVLGSMAAACCAVVLTLPLSMWYFGTVSLVSPISNVLALWAASAAFAGGALVCILAVLCPPLASALAVPVGWVLEYLLRVARWLGRGTFAALRLDNIYLLGWLAVLMALVAAVVCIRPLRRRPILPIASGALLLLLALTLRMNSVSGLPLTVTVLDVGQGSSTVFCSEGSFVAVDCGGNDAGTVLADYVQSGGGSKISALVLTHYDSDHIDGLETLLDRLSVELLLLPDTADDSGGREWVEVLAAEYDCPIRWVRETTALSFGQSTLTVYPPIETDGADNAGSLSALCRQGGFYALVTGDLGQEQEQALLELTDLPRLDVLVAGHHGSDDANGAQLLRETRPKAVVISVGENGYGLPGDGALRRMTDYRCEIYRTDENGTVTIRHR